jgi:hypothetical protein
MTLSKGLGINPTLFLHFTFLLQIAEFPWRARQDSNLRPSLFVVRFFERDAVGYGAKTRYLKVFGGMRRVAAVSGSRQRSRQRCEMASKE